MASPSPRFSSDASLSRAIVAENAEEAHSWWACLMVCRAHQRSPPLAAATLEAVAPAVEAATGPVLLTPRQAWRLGARVDEIDEACPTAGPLTGSKPTPFSLEYVYGMAALTGRSDRVFRKACRRAETALAARKLPLVVHAWSGSGISDEVLRRCESCRQRWMEHRAAGARAAAKREGRRYEGPPWAGVTKRGYLAAAAELRASPGACAMHAAMRSRMHFTGSRMHGCRTHRVQVRSHGWPMDARTLQAGGPSHCSSSPRRRSRMPTTAGPRHARCRRTCACTRARTRVPQTRSAGHLNLGTS